MIFYRITVTEVSTRETKLLGRFAPRTETVEHESIMIESATKPSLRNLAAILEPEPAP